MASCGSVSTMVASSSRASAWGDQFLPIGDDVQEKTIPGAAPQSPIPFPKHEPNTVASVLAPARRAASRRVVQRIEEMLQAVYLIDLNGRLLEKAARLEPASIRSLDAIHLATALSVDEPALEVITYDGRMAEAARANGLRVAQPRR